MNLSLSSYKVKFFCRMQQAIPAHLALGPPRHLHPRQLRCKWMRFPSGRVLMGLVSLAPNGRSTTCQLEDDLLLKKCKQVRSSGKIGDLQCASPCPWRPLCWERPNFLGRLAKQNCSDDKSRPGLICSAATIMSCLSDMSRKCSNFFLSSWLLKEVHSLQILSFELR